MCCQAAAAMTVCAPLLQQYKRMTTTSWSSQIINYHQNPIRALWQIFGPLSEWFELPGRCWLVSCVLFYWKPKLVWQKLQYKYVWEFVQYYDTQILFKNIIIFFSFHYYYTKKTSGLVSLAYIYKMTLHFQSCLCNGLACNSE